jgi:hypothetical protein
MFVIKDPDVFATDVIPQYFDHNKFSSFARQLNFYGFRKMQSKPIRNSDFDAGTAKHVTFYNENFKKGRCDLLKKIQRSTRGGGAASTTPGDQSREIFALREQVANLEQQILEVANQTEERVRRLELEMLSRMEQMMLAVQQQQRSQLQLGKSTSVSSTNSVASQMSVLSQQQSVLSQQQSVLSQQQSVPSHQQMAQVQAAVNNTWEPSPFSYPRTASASSAVNSVANAMVNNIHFQMPAPALSMKSHTTPTLPPHPKQKHLPLGSMPGGMGAPPDRTNSLRGISTLSRGLSGLTHSTSVESSASAVVMRNSWEDKFFSMLMLDGNEQGITEANLFPTPIDEGTPVVVSQSSMSAQAMSKSGPLRQLLEEDDLSDVSSSDLP